MSEYKLKIGITQGDTNGIGWEVILKTFADSRMVELCTPIIYGSEAAANFYHKSIAEIEPVQFNHCGSAREAKRGRVNLVKCGEGNLAIEPGKATAEAGKAAVAALKAAVADWKSGALDAGVTAPINKESVQSEGWNFTGHTEFFAAQSEGEPMMIMCSDRLRVGLVTIHIPVSEVSASITKEKIVASLTTLRQTLKQDFGVVEPRIAVLALMEVCSARRSRRLSSPPLLRRSRVACWPLAPSLLTGCLQMEAMPSMMRCWRCITIRG